MTLRYILSAITVASVIATIGYNENDSPLLDKLLKANKMSDHNITDVLKDQGIGGGEHGVGGAEIIENITTSDGIPDYGLEHFPSSATAGVSTKIAPPRNPQGGGLEKDMNNEQKIEKPKRIGNKLKAGANKSESGPGIKGERNRGSTPPGRRNDLSADETWNTSLSGNSDGGPNPTDEPGRKTSSRCYTAFIAILYMGIALFISALAAKFIKKRRRCCRRRKTRSMMDFDEESIYPL